MIEVRQDGDGQGYNVFDGETLLCAVATIRRVYGTAKHRCNGHGWICVAAVRPDWPATKARAEHIAEALRHYQQSQEGERAP